MKKILITPIMATLVACGGNDDDSQNPRLSIQVKSTYSAIQESNGDWVQLTPGVHNFSYEEGTWVTIASACSYTYLEDGQPETSRYFGTQRLFIDEEVIIEDRHDCENLSEENHTQASANVDIQGWKLSDVNMSESVFSVSVYSRNQLTEFYALFSGDPVLTSVFTSAIRESDDQAFLYIENNVTLSDNDVYTPELARNNLLHATSLIDIPEFPEELGVAEFHTIFQYVDGGYAIMTNETDADEDSLFAVPDTLKGEGKILQYWGFDNGSYVIQEADTDLAPYPYQNAPSAYSRNDINLSQDLGSVSFPVYENQFSDKSIAVYGVRQYVLDNDADTSVEYVISPEAAVNGAVTVDIVDFSTLPGFPYDAPPAPENNTVSAYAILQDTGKPFGNIIIDAIRIGTNFNE